MLPGNCVLAELHIAEQVYDTQNLSNANSAACCSLSAESPTSPSKEQLAFDFGDSPLNEEWKNRITQSLSTYSDVFACHDLDFGHATKVKHKIKLKDETPIKQRSRPIHPNDYEAVRKHLKMLLDAGVIRPSESPFSSPIVVVKKKTGEVRLCVDYRKINVQTIKDAYALPNLEETFSALSGSNWFSVMDLKSGYYQIEMEEEDKPKTAFVCPLGFYEFNRMPQGITNAPSTFQRLMERCMGDINLREVLVFLDDLIVFSSTLEEHEQRLKHVLERLREYGLKLSPSKCRFFQTSVKYLGHIVSKDGVKTDPEKVAAIKTWPVPQNLKQLKSFLGFTGYYRRFVKDYSKIVRPLNDLTCGYPPVRKGQKKGDPSKYHNPREPFADRWTQACQSAFECIKDKLTSSPVLGFADPKLQYVLHTDASTTGLGAALYQEQNGKMRVIAYASRGLTPSETRYAAHKLEFLALKWSIVEKFHDYLYGNEFTVITDNNPLTYILTTAKLDAASYRWLAALSTFNFQIKYRAGKANQDADGLSRRPHQALAADCVTLEEENRIHQLTSRLLGTPQNSNHLCPDTVTAVCHKHLVNETNGNSPQVVLVESLAMSVDAIPDAYSNADASGQVAAPLFSEHELKEHQKSDSNINRVIQLLESCTNSPRNIQAETLEIKLMLRIKKVRTSPYHPRGNPVERFNRTILSMLGTLRDDQKVHWRDFVKPLTHAYNCSKNEVTGFSPYELMFGRRPKLPVDLAFGLPVAGDTPTSHSQYVRNLKAKLEESYQIALENSKKVAERNKNRFDKTVRESTLQVGDRVLVKNVRLRNKHKLADKWETSVYLVTKKMENIPVYVVQPEKGDGPTRTLHRDLLLACGDLSDTEEEIKTKPKAPHRPKTRQSAPDTQDIEMSDSEEEFECIPTLPQIQTETFFEICDKEPTTSNVEMEATEQMESNPPTQLDDSLPFPVEIVELNSDGVDDGTNAQNGIESLDEEPFPNIPGENDLSEEEGESDVADAQQNQNITDQQTAQTTESILDTPNGVDVGPDGLKLISDIIREKMEIDVSVLMGANIANEVAAEKFCETTIGSRILENGLLFKELLQTPNFRITVVEDADTVELCGALKNIVAVGAGFCDGLRCGDNTKAAVIRLGLMEMIAFTKLFSRDKQTVSTATFLESCGVADLITTCYGGRNRRVAEAFARTGKSIEELEKEMLNGQKLQGPATSAEVYQILKQKNLVDKFPLFSAVYLICFEGKPVRDMITCLQSHPEHM
ncbi:hypothetical protein WMY93_025679 [Mugilogobius chulae]|uniref:Glycerol-3-phosphate dehydrogenase [NAD(+)] n=1 Tax=Mugilogobius chulae TaxID=88201 RepID=A0AAW0MZJ6_9GOBI